MRSDGSQLCRASYSALRTADDFRVRRGRAVLLWRPRRGRGLAARCGGIGVSDGSALGSAGARSISPTACIHARNGSVTAMQIWLATTIPMRV
jgi:hypothetical protein